MHEIDIVICTYNRAQRLDRALDALARQREVPGLDWGILVVDNNSTDDSYSVVERHRRTGLPVSYVVEPTPGLTAARRRGLESTQAPWIAYVDDDCLVASSWLEATVQFARSRPECGAFGGRVSLEWERQPPGFVRRFPWAYAAQDHGPEPVRVGLLVGTGMVVSRAALKRCGWAETQFFADRVGERLLSGGDVEMALRLGARSELWYAPSCELSHVIAADRGTLSHLSRVVFGLGASKYFEDSMLWRGSYRRWQLASVARAGAIVRRIVLEARLMVARRRSPADVLVRLSFLCGWFAGAWKLARRSAEERRAILGCAWHDSP